MIQYRGTVIKYSRNAHSKYVKYKQLTRVKLNCSRAVINQSGSRAQESKCELQYCWPLHVIAPIKWSGRTNTVPALNRMQRRYGEPERFITFRGSIKIVVHVGLKGSDRSEVFRPSQVFRGSNRLRHMVYDCVRLE